MQPQRSHSASGHVYRVTRTKGRVWYAKYRLPDGMQVQRALGREWGGKGRPPEGYFTARTAQAALDAILVDARRGKYPSRATTAATFADASAEWLRYVEVDRQRKPSTVSEYKSVVSRHLDPAFGTLPLAQVTSERIDRWRADAIADGKLSRRTIQKVLTNLHSIFERARKVYGLQTNPVADVERPTPTYTADLDFYAPEEVHALARAASNEQDGGIYLTAAFTGLRRGELIALRWREIDFDASTIRVRASFTHGVLTTPKSGKVRSVPMVDEVAKVLARLSTRERFTGPDDLVFPGMTGEHLDGSALRRRYGQAQAAAGLRRLRFHDLRHVFGSLAISSASVVQVQHWMGHADSDTTHRYLHYKPRRDEAKLLADAFAVPSRREG